MQRLTTLKLSLLAASLAAVSAPSYAEFDPEGDGIPYVAYGDGHSYSLPITQEITGCSGPGCDYYVPSTPGAIKDLIVVATGASGTQVTTNVDGIDDAYETPNGVQGANFYETSNVANDPGASNAAPTTQYMTSWDADISSLQGVVGNELVFFFNNNQINSCDSACQSLAIWAQLWVTDANGDIVDLNGDGGIGAGDILEFTNQLPDWLTGAGNIPAPYALVPDGGGIPSAIGGDANLYTSGITNPAGYEPLAGTNAATDYVLSGGEICLDAGFVPVPCGDPTQAFGPFEHNLGANEAAYAVIFPELNAFIESLGAMSAGYTLHVDFNMGCDPLSGGRDDLICTGEDGGDLGRNLNNGYEQIFIGGVGENIVPAPASVLLLGLGLLGMGLVRRKVSAA